MRRTVWTLTFALVAAACGTESGGGEPARAEPGAARGGAIEAPLPRLEVFRGHVAFGPAVRSFRPCGSGQLLGVQDRSGLLRDLHEALRPHAEPIEEVFVSVLGVTGPAPEAGYPGELAVAEVEYAAVEGRGCESDWRFRFRAAGNEPFWAVTVSGDTLRLTVPDASERVWPGVLEQATADGLRITVSADASLTLDLTKRACRDSMSGAWSQLTASLRLDGRSLEGCAVRGDAAVGR